MEFALILPMFAGTALGGLEMGNYILANNKVQRLATMTADLVAQSGAGGVGASERQIYDLFSAIDVSAQPFDIRKNGRVVITAVKGEDVTPSDPSKVVINHILWQRFDGAYVAAKPVLGCHADNKPATLPGNRTLPEDEVLFHVQVSYHYQPLIRLDILNMLSLPADFSRTALFRARSKDFQKPTPEAKFPAKQNCSTATGL